MESTLKNTPRQLLPAFYKKYDLKHDGGAEDSKVKIEITKNIYLYIPNSDTRRKALLKHDIHHIITGYKSNFKGETEISSWEIASGCNTYWAAWVLDLYGMLYGFWFNLPNVFKAFIRGRRSRNLYSDVITDDVALNMPVEDLQEILHLPPIDQHLKATINDVFSFLMWSLIGGIFSILSLLLLPPAILYNLYIAVTAKY